MSRLCQSIFCLAAIMVALAAPGQTVQPVPVKFSRVATNLPPPLPKAQSPVDFFRRLLLMSPAERSQALTGRTPEARARILAKVREYLALNPDERELRLRATELRWYLVPLLRAAPADREAQLALVPPELRNLAKSRLMQWDLLPPQLQQQYLANDTTLRYVTQAPMPPSTNAAQEKIAEQFNSFLDFTPVEQQQMLGTLSDAERAQMEKTLKTFEQLPPQQRFICVRNYTKFAGMNGAERAEFLKNAESWSKMSPQERQNWRDLVAHVPLWPPLPSAPPMPPHIAPKAMKANMATN